jgi:hypothetical protein
MRAVRSCGEARGVSKQPPDIYIYNVVGVALSQASVEYDSGERREREEEERGGGSGGDDVARPASPRIPVGGAAWRIWLNPAPPPSAAPTFLCRPFSDTRQLGLALRTRQPLVDPVYFYGCITTGLTYTVHFCRIGVKFTVQCAISTIWPSVLC